MATADPARRAGEGFDVIGDVHGHAAKLVELLKVMGYDEANGAWRHPERRAVFVGDLIDRGPEQFESVDIARTMVDAEAALIVAGNHEFNAVAFNTPDPHRPGEYLRPRNAKNRDQHKEFLHQVSQRPRRHTEIIEWFMTLPLWLELDGLRVVHACWDQSSIDALAGQVTAADSLTAGLVISASTHGSLEWHAVETLLKGPEIAIDAPYLDKDGHERDQARFRWWLPEADQLSIGAMIPGGTTGLDGKPYPELPDTPIKPPVEAYRNPIPVIYGHYWQTGATEVTSDRTACVDYSAGEGGPLVAYRWSGETTLTSDNFVSAG